MIKFMKSWCEGIIVAIVISIIIEILVPEGNNKKYVKVIVGIYVVFVVLNPILSKIDNNFKIENILEFESSIEVSSSAQDNIKKVYINGMEETLKQEILENFEYIVQDVEFKVDLKYENIEKIKLKIIEKQNENIISIQPIGIEEKINSNENIENIEEIDNSLTQVKKYVAQNYNVDIENIEIVR